MGMIMRIIMISFWFFLFSFLNHSFSYALSWQDTLKNEFDIVDTFDHYQDWRGTLSSGAQPCILDTSDLPKYQDNTPGPWGMYCGEKTYDNDWWITNHGPNYQVGSKGLKLYTRGTGPTEIKRYIGTGTPGSGYSDIYIFFRLYLPKNTWPTYVEIPADGGGTMGYNEGDPYIFLTGWKFVNIGTGFNDVQNWNDQGYNIYGSTTAWYHLLYNDPNPYTISAQLQLFSATYWYPAKPNYIPTNELVGIELHYKLESTTNCTIDVDCDGIFESWVYDSINPTGLKLQETQHTKYRPVGDDALKINRIWLNGNKHDYDQGMGGITGEYYCGTGMNCVMYIDDFIVDDQRIGPKYFSLLNGSNHTPAAPTDLRIVN